MAYSIQRAVSDGTMTLLPISIEYFDRDEISVLFDGVLNARQWAWVGTTDKTLSFTPAVANAVEVSVVRSTDLAALRHEFSNGAQFTAESLDESLLQILHIAQEARENANLGEVFQDLNFHGFKAINVGDGANPMDAVNMRQLGVHDATISMYRDQTAGFKNAAEAAATSAAASNAGTAGAITSHVALPDPHTQYVLKSAVTTMAKTDVGQNFTAPQRSAILPDNDGSFNLADKQNFVCSPSGPTTLDFTNRGNGLSGSILLNNDANYVISKGPKILLSTAALSRLSASGKYRIDYMSDGTTVWCTASENLLS